MGFWTRVRLPSTPLDAEETNCRSTAQIAVFRNVFSIVISTNIKDIPRKPAKLTFGLIQKWIEDNHGMKVSKSSITQVKNKCEIQNLEFGTKSNVVPDLKTEKEKLVLKAFEYYGIV
ncbi:MAG: hypothetical protein IJ379_09210 [Lachnospiraceae bacterium]|nr:hypothetical protein [Lachnospiraceae bacterium]